MGRMNCDQNCTLECCACLDAIENEQRRSLGRIAFALVCFVVCVASWAVAR